MMDGGEMKRIKSHPFMPRAWRSSGIKQATNKTLVDVINKEGEFNFCPYVYTLSGVTHFLYMRNTTETSS